MIRRWSCLNIFGSVYVDNAYFKRLFRIKTFRKTVRFKRYRYRKKFKWPRPQIRKIKHNNMWPLYYNVLKYWTLDVGYTKQHSKFQYYYGFFSNNCTAVDLNFFCSYNRKMYNFLDECIIASITKKLLIGASRRNLDFVLINNNKFNWHSVAFFPTPDILETPLIAAGNAFHDSQAFPFNGDPDINEIDPLLEFDFINELVYSQSTELYKILTLLWLEKILVLNKNVSRIFYAKKNLHFFSF